MLQLFSINYKNNHLVIALYVEKIFLVEIFALVYRSVRACPHITPPPLGFGGIPPPHSLGLCSFENLSKSRTNPVVR